MAKIRDDFKVPNIKQTLKDFVKDNPDCADVVNNLLSNDKDQS